MSVCWGGLSIAYVAVARNDLRGDITCPPDGSPRLHRALGAAVIAAALRPDEV